MTRRMYRAYMEVKRENRKPHRARSDFERQKKVLENFEKFKKDYYSGARGCNKICKNWP